MTEAEDDATARHIMRHLRRGRRGDPCVYCGETPTLDNATMDHVFPDNLYEPLPDNVFTVLACRPCNAQKEPGDHVLHNYVTFHNDRHRSADLFVHLEKIARATHRRQSPLGDATSQAIEIRKLVDPFGRGGPIPIELGDNSGSLHVTLDMIVRGLSYGSHGVVLPPSVPVESKVLTPEEAEKFARIFALSPEIWLGKQGSTEWAMFTSPGDPHSVLTIFSIDGVYFAGASGNFVSNDAQGVEGGGTRPH